MYVLTVTSSTHFEQILFHVKNCISYFEYLETISRGKICRHSALRVHDTDIRILYFKSSNFIFFYRVIVFFIYLFQTFSYRVQCNDYISVFLC